MKKPILHLLLLFFVALIFSGCTGKKKTTAEESFLGEWYTVKGDVEAYSFLRDDNGYILTGMLHERPVAYGTWKIDGDKFVITMDNGTVTSYAYSLANDTLVFNNGREIYTRTAPLEVRFPEVRILKDLASDFGSHIFSSPIPVDISWGMWDDSLRSSQDLALKGYSITMRSSLLSDDLENLSGYLSDHGFIKDTVYVTEICSGFWDDNQLVTMCTSQDPEATSDSISVIVSSAIIK